MSADASSIAVFGTTDVGKHRENNEDAFVISKVREGSAIVSGDPVGLTLEPEGLLLMVCDGMGGAAAGEIAARLACESVAQALSAERAAPASTGRPALFSALRAANRTIHDESRRRSEERGMGTTCTAVLVLPGRLVVGQVGDSRAYLYRDGKLQLLTRDQSLAAALQDSGVLAAADVKDFPHANVILQALGVQREVDPVMTDVELQVGDTILVCSDGLHGPVPDERIAEVLGSTEHLGDSARSLVREALDAGGPDNVTVLLARLEPTR